MQAHAGVACSSCCSGRQGIGQLKAQAPRQQPAKGVHKRTRGGSGVGGHEESVRLKKTTRLMVTVIKGNPKQKNLRS